MGKYDHLAVISAARQNPAASSRQACPPFSSNVGRAKGYHGTVILSPRADNAFGIFGNAAMSSLENVLENSVNNVPIPPVGVMSVASICGSCAVVCKVWHACNVGSMFPD